ncbi:M-phase phosphoprotein [Dirofilaria immitis]
MDNGSTKAESTEKDSEINETNRNEKKNEDEEKDNDEDEKLDDDEFEVDRILSVAVMNGKVKYQVRWKGYGSDEDSWEPEQNLATARLILDDYIANHKDEVKKVQDTILAQKKLRKRRRKGYKKLQRSSSSDWSEISHDRAKKKMRFYGNDVKKNNDNGSDKDDVFRKRESRYRTTYTEERTSLSKNKSGKSFSKELSPKKAKNAWLYDDADDVDSDASEGNEKMKKNADFLRKGKTNNQLKESSSVEKNNMLLATTKEQCDGNSDQKKIAVLLNENREKREEEAPAKVEIAEEDYEPKVEFIGIVQCPDGAVKVVYMKKDESKAHVVSVREAFEIDGYGLRLYFFVIQTASLSIFSHISQHAVMSHLSISNAICAKSTVSKN